MNGEQSSQPPETVTQLRASLQLIVLKSLRPISLGLGTLFSIFAFAHAWSLPPGIRGPMVFVASATAVLLLGIYVVLRGGGIPARRAHPLGSAIAALVLVNSLLHLHLSAEPQQTTNVALLVIAAGCFFLSARWLAVVLAAALGGWAAVAYVVGPSRLWPHFGFMLLSSTILSVLIYAVRVHTLRKLESLRLLDARRKAELEEAVVAARLSEDRYKQIVNEASDIIYRTDVRGRFTFFNPTAIRLLKRPAHELQGLYYGDLIPPEYREAARRFYGKQLEERTPETYYEFPAMAKDGTLIWLGQNVQLVTDGDEVVGFLAFARDITERKRAEEAITQAEEYRNLFRLANDAIIIFDPEGEVVLEVNDKACEVYGFAREDFVGRSMKEISRDPRRGEQELVRLLAAGSYQEFETVQFRSDGTPLHFHINASVIEYGGRKAILSINRDVTEQKRTQEQLLLISRAVEGIGDGVRISDPGGHSIYHNPAFVRLFGFTAEELNARGGIESLFVDKTIAEKMIASTLGGGSWRSEAELFARDGRIVMVEITRDAINDEAGKVIGLVSIYTDITERKWIEDALRRSEGQYRGLVENAKDMIVTFDLTGRFTSANLMALQLTGYTLEEALQLNLWQVVAPEFRETARRMLANKISGADDRTIYELELLAKDGRRISLDVSSWLIYKDGVPVGAQAIGRDVTERKHLEEQLRQSQKMEAVGRLAGGIAHDFNNLLAVITMQCGLMLHKLAPGDRMRQRAEEINEASKRAASLTQQLLAFSRQQVLQPKVLDLNEVVSDMTKMLRRVIGEDIQLMISLDPQAGRVRVDSGQLGQVLMNLAVNARDAMPRGGILAIETSRVGPDEEFVSSHLPAEPRPYVRLTVTDNGTGMAPEVQKRIFEPFFTTKGIGKGTGLGLSTAYGIIKQSEGHLLVSSQLGQGTTFKIFLPSAAESVKPEAGEEGHPALPTGTETILLVEDEEMLRSITRNLLEDLGYTVLVAADGAEALAICEQQSSQFDLIITDVVMPRISGRELVDRLSRVWPKQRVLYMSGYTDDAILRHGVLKEGANFIQKPYTPAALAQKLRESLDGSD